jgi:hypothetical protein
MHIYNWNWSNLITETHESDQPKVTGSETQFYVNYHIITEKIRTSQINGTNHMWMVDKSRDGWQGVLVQTICGLLQVHINSAGGVPCTVHPCTLSTNLTESIALSTRAPCLPISPRAILRAEWRLLDHTREAIIRRHIDWRNMSITHCFGRNGCASWNRLYIAAQRPRARQRRHRE